jgi:UDP-N-acetylmuramoyl-L-alanyl-D-glutamate--2,6-diaminopimelate ligase
MLGTLTGARTTPEAPDLQRALAGFRGEGCTAVAMEVSSHALALHRTDGTRFAVGVFTNLGRDHLDFHGTMDAYFAAKARLFEAGACTVGVVNTDDPWGRRLAEQAGVPVVAYGMADAAGLELGPTRSRFSWRGHPVEVPLGGTFNVGNALAALEAVVAAGVEPGTAAAGLASVPPVPGRFEAVDAGQPFAVVVDYAHTPEGLEAVLVAARAGTAGRVLVVFGCGGDRDADKRPRMGAVAAERADVVVLTSDNPRSEDPAAIIAAVLDGIAPPHRSRTVVEPERRAAIATAFAEARPGDVVVIAGKGHETTQDLGPAGTVPFDDRAVARELLEARP